MTKELSKEIITRSTFRSNYLIDKTEENCFLCTHQRNKCVSLLRSTKNNYYENLNEKDVTNSKELFEDCKTLTF